MSVPSEIPTFKLYYFNLKAIAETTRLLFAYGGQAYEDIRVKDEEWSAFKPSTECYIRKRIYSKDLFVI